MDFVKYLKSLIEAIKIKEAIQKLSSLFTVSNSDLETTAIILAADYNRLRVERLEGVISVDVYNRRLATLTKRLLELINEVDKDIEIYRKYIDENTNSVKREEAEAKRVILFLASNPQELDIDLKKELQEISQKLELIDKRKAFEFRFKTDLRKKDFQRSIIELDAEPRFLHFAGSGSYKSAKCKDGLILGGDDFKSTAILEPRLMTKILRKFTSLECIFLNACNTTPLALELSKYIPYIIAMDNYVTDRLAISFASSFYEAIASNKSIDFAFEYSMDNMELEEKFTSTELKTPRLIKNGENVDYKWPGTTYEEWQEIVYGKKEITA